MIDKKHRQPITKVLQKSYKKTCKMIQNLYNVRAIRKAMSTTQDVKKGVCQNGEQLNVFICITYYRMSQEFMNELLVEEKIMEELDNLDEDLLLIKQGFRDLPWNVELTEIGGIY